MIFDPEPTEFIGKKAKRSPGLVAEAWIQSRPREQRSAGGRCHKKTKLAGFLMSVILENNIMRLNSCNFWSAGEKLAIYTQIIKKIKKKQLLISEKANHASSEKVIRTQFS